MNHKILVYYRSRSLLIINLIILLGLTSNIYGQSGPIKNLRYDDDFDYLRHETIVKKGTDKLKFIPIFKNGDSYVSFGGEIREWYELRKNNNFGDLPPGQVEDPNGVLQHRFMLHADFEIGKRFRVFGQVNNTLEFGNINEPIPEIAVDGLGIHQLFVDVRTGKKGSEAKSIFRIGRQEYIFGNELLVSSREGPNNRQAFDGITFIKIHPDYQVHVLAATPVIIHPKIFDNDHTDEALWGVYANLRTRKINHLDLYYLGLYSERRAYNFTSGNQNRHTIGARLWSHGHSFFYDIETMYQTGKFNDLTINAFNFTGEIRYVFQDILWKPMIGFGASYITGDYDYNDNQLNTYDPLYPKPVYGLAMPQGPSNISHLKPTFGLQPVEQLFIDFKWYWLARTSVYDGTYTPDMVQVRPIPPATSDKFSVGKQYAIDLFYIINKNLTFINFLSYVKPGNYIKETGAGKDLFYWASAIQYKF